MTFNDYFKELPVLETRRLLLRPFTYDDIGPYLDFFADPEVQKYLGNLPIPKDLKAARQWIDNMNGRCFKSKLVITWCIDLKDEKSAIGRIDLGGFVKKSMADIAYYLSKNYWNLGITSEAARAVVKFGFEALGLHRIQTTVLPENIYSLQLLKNIGFREEGLLRQYLHGTEFKDTLMLGMLKEDYLKTMKINDRQ